ncbi:hypothetical protein LH51_01325 [Nitrincola sp. A-D6]|uniref:AAC(3) family N-acetyltransferase n=1 Tax=Nitrincola sp. A-D6 TaxID=1545442 RepID=UPI00051FA0B7|nr:AAC(3) family N-acetyltransferase [Nitrincola sp. A-D6]KGK43297.1 hypothetical protein LH51_01325 [Nitrincola sp. A-D6]
MIDKDSLIEDLKNLGIKSGDTVFIRASLSKVGRLKSSDRNIIIESLLESVGENGTLVTLGFTKIFSFWNLKDDYVFDKNTPSTTGALSKMFLGNPNCKRSQHPCCSFLAIGPKSDYILEGHNEQSTSYIPIKKLIDLNAHCLLIGCIDDSPGFTTVHYVQEELGLTNRSLISSIFRVYYKSESGKNELFIRKDIGGCSAGFDKFYGHYLKAGILKVGRFGNANCISAYASDLYKIDKDLIRNNKKFPLCDNSECVICRCTWTYNLTDIPKFILAKIRKVFFR